MQQDRAQAEEVPPLKLADCGLEDVVSALLGGRRIACQGEGNFFVLNSEDARKVFAYYAEHRDLWPRAKQVQAREVDELLKILGRKAPARAESKTHAGGPPKLWRLRRVEAHRFGGLHRHCGPGGEDPETFALEIDRDITLIGGFNGAGKTALQNVIIWCLTGKALRSQHMPAEIHAPMEVSWIGSGGEDGEEEETDEDREYALPPVVPVPSGADLAILKDQPKIDTWAQLTFHGEDNNDLCVVRRALTVGRTGTISMTVTGLDGLGLPNLAIEAGTLMPGIATHMRFDEKTTFAQAIAQLTGLKPFEDLGRRSQRIVKRLRTDEKRRTETDADAKLTDFRTKYRAIEDAWTAKPDLGDPAKIISPDEEHQTDRCKQSIVDARTFLEEQKTALEGAAEVVLGHAPQIASKQDLDGTLAELSAAADAMKGAALSSLPSVIVINKLKAITEQDCLAATSLIDSIIARGHAVAERLRNKAEAARWQLYTTVASWHREHHPGRELRDCPVCGTNLDDVPPDALLNTAVKEALRLCREADADAAKSAQDWEKDAAREFLDGLPESLRLFADTDLGNDLLGLYRKAYAEELLTDHSFARRLKPIKQNAAKVWQSAASEFPLPKEFAETETMLPKELQSGSLFSRLANVRTALRLSKRRTAVADLIKGIVERYLGSLRRDDSGEQTPASRLDTPANLLPLRVQIDTLRKCVENTAPIVSLLRQLDALEKTRQDYCGSRERLILLERAAVALEMFSGFETLVFEQVSGLIQALDQDTRDWLAKIYSPHYRGGPSYSGFDPGDEKGLGLRAGIGDMKVPAYQVMNAALLRACVWAFVFSLWEHIRAQSGGIDCMLLDDPQTHFDPMNAENLAAIIPLMPEHHMRPVITSNDHRFLAAIRDKLHRRSSDPPSWQAWLLNPISRSRLTAGVSPSVEDVFELQEEWKDDENNTAKAQAFVNKVRLYVENRLWDLLATDPIVMHKPTLAHLLGALRGARKNGEPPFEEPPFEALLNHPALKDNASFYEIINKAHHRLHEITPHQAGQVNELFGAIDRLLRSCSASYARFMGRLTREDSDLFLTEIPNAPDPVKFEKLLFPVLGDVSARSSFDALASTAETQTFDISELGPLALYGVRSPGLGALALQGQIIMASLDKEACDGDPVIALYGDRIFARRLFTDRRDTSRIVLACDRSGTEKVPPAEVLPRAKTRIMPIVGVLYDQERFGGKEEACPVDGCKLLHRNLLAAQVVDDSAYPIIGNGDRVLLEAIKNPTPEEIARLEDRIVVAVAAQAGDSFAYLKRLGGEIYPGVRILENVGLKGSALAITVKAESAAGELHTLQTVWRVHGALRKLGK
jgi:hypothetical protein